MRQCRVGDIRLVRGVVHDDGAVLVGVVDPCLQTRLVDDGARRVVREAQVNERNILVGMRQLGSEPVFPRAGHVDHIAPQARCLIVCARAARHHVGIDVNGIHRVAYRYAGIRAENLLDVRRIGFRAVADEHLIRRYVGAPSREIALGNGLT